MEKNKKHAIKSNDPSQTAAIEEMMRNKLKNTQQTMEDALRRKD